MISTSKIRLALFVFLVATLVLGFYLLIVPDNPVIRLFRGEISDTDANIIIGPYPTEIDFSRLKSAKVGTVISLLDPALPYEKILLDQEKTLASKHAMKFMNFPMTSVLGYKVGQDYESNANAAAKAVASTEGKTYIHCYLGIHRAKTVKDLIEAQHQAVGNYLLKEGERAPLARMQDQAEQLYNQKNYQETKRILSHMPSQNFAAMMLNAWASYRLRNISEARTLFSTATTIGATSEVDVGLAFCDLYENKLDEASKRFLAVIAKEPENESALSGAGLALYRQGDFAESAKLLQRALALNDKDKDASAALKHIQNTQLVKN